MTLIVKRFVRCIDDLWRIAGITLVGVFILEVAARVWIRFVYPLQNPLAEVHASKDLRWHPYTYWRGRPYRG